MIELHNIDCMEYMATCKDNAFDLAIVDPPYGLGKRTVDGGSKKNTQTKFMVDIRRTNWDDNTPKLEYFTELKRVSKNQIIWGANYFVLHEYRCFIVWDKMTYAPTMSQVELAYTSYDTPARLIKINSNQPDRTHPTQKPVRLYDWLLRNYAEKGQRILDTHAGSCSSAIAAHYFGVDFVGCELDKDYFEAAQKRIDKETRQTTLF